MICDSSDYSHVILQALHPVESDLVKEEVVF